MSPTVPASVVVVTHNEGELLRATVDSLEPTLPEGSEILVVDDGSTDGSTEFLDGGHGRARVIRPSERLGASGARRLGASESVGDSIVFSDAHVEVAQGWFEEVSRALDIPGVGLVAPVITSLNNRAVRGYGRTWKGPSLDWRWLNRRGQGDQPYVVPLLSGCFVASKRQTLEEVGSFDPGFIIWGEEGADLSLRCWRRGLECRVTPATEVAHLFRPAFPFAIDRETTLHNQLRLATLHFSTPRLQKVIEALKGFPAFSGAMAKVMAGDAWSQRARLAETSLHDDDWFFKRFPVEGL